MSFFSSTTQTTVLFIAYLLCHRILSQEYADAACIADYWDTFARGETSPIQTVSGTTDDGFLLTLYPFEIADSDQEAEISAVAVLPGSCFALDQTCSFVAYTIAGSETVYLGNLYFLREAEAAEIMPIGELPLTDVTGMDFDCNGVLYVVNRAGQVYRVTLAEDGSIESTRAVATAEQTCSADICTELLAYDYNEDEFIRISAPTDPTSGAAALICQGLEAEECQVIADPNDYCPSSAINGVNYIGNGLALAVCTMGDGTTNYVLLDTEEGELIEFVDGLGFVNMETSSGPLLVGIQTNDEFNWPWCGAQTCDDDDSSSDGDSDSDSADNAMMQLSDTLDSDLPKETDATHYTFELSLSDSLIHKAWAIAAMVTAVCLTAAFFVYRRNLKAQLV